LLPSLVAPQPFSGWRSASPWSTRHTPADIAVTAGASLGQPSHGSPVAASSQQSGSLASRASQPRCEFVPQLCDQQVGLAADVGRPGVERELPLLVIAILKHGDYDPGVLRASQRIGSNYVLPSRPEATRAVASRLHVSTLSASARFVTGRTFRPGNSRLIALTAIALFGPAGVRENKLRGGTAAGQNMDVVRCHEDRGTPRWPSSSSDRLISVFG
jgi:hypothetical protein